VLEQVGSQARVIRLSNEEQRVVLGPDDHRSPNYQIAQSAHGHSLSHLEDTWILASAGRSRNPSDFEQLSGVETWHCR
jgi:hypothetical protein